MAPTPQIRTPRRPPEAKPVPPTGPRPVKSGNGPAPLCPHIGPRRPPAGPSDFFRPESLYSYIEIPKKHARWRQFIGVFIGAGKHQFSLVNVKRLGANQMSFQHLSDNLARDPDYLDRLIDENEAALFIGYSVRALQGWRVKGGGPRFVKVSARSVRYRRRDLIEWAESRLKASTSEV